MLWYDYIIMLGMKIIIEVCELIITIGIHWYNIGIIDYIYIINIKIYIQWFNTLICIYNRYNIYNKSNKSNSIKSNNNNNINNNNNNNNIPFNITY